MKQYTVNYLTTLGKKGVSQKKFPKLSDARAFAKAMVDLGRFKSLETKAGAKIPYTNKS